MKRKESRAARFLFMSMYVYTIKNFKTMLSKEKKIKITIQGNTDHVLVSIPPVFSLYTYGTFSSLRLPEASSH